MVTNGVQSYTVFTYQCGELNWVQGRSASIGFTASSASSINHPLSRLPKVNDIACLKQQCSPWSNVVYQISREPGDTLHAHLKSIYFPQKVINCDHFFPQKCFDVLVYNNSTCTFQPCKNILKLFPGHICIQENVFNVTASNTSLTINQTTVCLACLFNGEASEPSTVWLLNGQIITTQSSIAKVNGNGTLVIVQPVRSPGLVLTCQHGGSMFNITLNGELY